VGLKPGTKVDWRTNGRHIVTLSTGSKSVTVSETDNTWVEGGIGYDAYLGDGGTVYFDHVVKNECHPPNTGAVVDDFADDGLSEYTTNRGSASTTSGPTYFGSNSLEISGTDTELVSTSGLPSYPSAGDRFRVRVRATGGASTTKFRYGVQDGNKDRRYAITLDFINDGVGLYYEDGNAKTLIAEDAASCILSEDEWYRVEVDWRSQGTHTVSLYNDSEDCLSQISGTDSTLTGGGIGFAASLSSSGGTVHYDHILVDGLNWELKNLADEHDGINYTTVEDISDVDGNTRISRTHHCGDGTTHSITYREISSKKLKVHGLDTEFWRRVPEEAISRTEKLRDIGEEKINGGVL
jgi:hypothetical protein